MDALGHESVNTSRIYTHSNVKQIRAAIERRNQVLPATPGEGVEELATKPATIGQIDGGRNNCKSLKEELVALPGIEPGFED